MCLYTCQIHSLWYDCESKGDFEYIGDFKSIYDCESIVKCINNKFNNIILG